MSGAAAAAQMYGTTVITRAKPTLLNTAASGLTRGSNTGAAIATHPAGFCLCFDTRDDNLIPTALGGSWVTIVSGSTTLGENIQSFRLSSKVVTADEGIPAKTGSRRSFRIYSNYALDQDPVFDFETTNGNGNNATVPFSALSLLSEGGATADHLLVGFAKREGSGTFTWAAPAGTEPHNQNTTGVAGSAESSGVVTTPGSDLVMAVGSNNEWSTIAVALLGAII